MRSLLFSLVGFAFVLSAAAQGQTPPAKQQVLDELAKNGIHLGEDESDGKKVTTADARVANPETLKALGLLQFVKDLATVSITIKDAKYTKDSLATLKTFPDLKELRVDAKSLTESDLRTITSIDKLERLSLVCLEFTDAQMNVLGDLKKTKGLNSLFLESAVISPVAVATLKRELAQVKEIEVHRVPSVFLMEPLEITPNDALVAKLQKQKFNAAVASITNLRALIRVGKLAYADQNTQFIDCLHNLKNAAIDLNDPILTPKAIDDYVQIAAMVHKESFNQFELGRLDPYKYHAFAYEYADAQLFQLRRRQQMEKKADK